LRAAFIVVIYKFSLLLLTENLRFDRFIDLLALKIDEATVRNLVRVRKF
jgi:hypothetical protein